MLNVYAVFDEEVQCVEVQWQSGQFGGSVSGTYCGGNNFAFDVPPGTTSRPACVESNSMSATGDVIVSIIGDCEPIEFSNPSRNQYFITQGKFTVDDFCLSTYSTTTSVWSSAVSVNELQDDTLYTTETGNTVYVGNDLNFGVSTSQNSTTWTQVIEVTSEGVVTSVAIKDCGGPGGGGKGLSPGIT